MRSGFTFTNYAQINHGGQKTIKFQNTKSIERPTSHCLPASPTYSARRPDRSIWPTNFGHLNVRGPWASLAFAHLLSRWFPARPLCRPFIILIVTFFLSREPRRHQVDRYAASCFDKEPSTVEFQSRGTYQVSLSTYRDCIDES